MTFVYLLHHYKNYACSYLFLIVLLLFLYFLLSVAIYWLQVTTFLTLARVVI
jgi:hypothetical protein